MITFTPAQSLVILLAYFLAALPFGVILSLLVAKKDVRDQGSGNTGASNVSRLMGKKWGIVVLLLDALKGYVAVKAARHFGSANFENLIAVLAVTAHCWPIYLGFKGGKGVATALGVLAALSPTVVLYALGAWILVFLLYRRTSGGSLFAALSLPFIAFFEPSKLSLWAAWSIAAIVWWKHKDNIVRIWRNEEPRFF